MEADSVIERITRQIEDLENQIQINRVDGNSGVFTLRYEVGLLEKRKPQTEEIVRIRELDIGENRPLKPAIYAAFFAFDDKLPKLGRLSQGG